jgi:hypothetical protein
MMVVKGKDQDIDEYIAATADVQAILQDPGDDQEGGAGRRDDQLQIPPSSSWDADQLPPSASTSGCILRLGSERFNRELAA